ncbi:MAG: hypothetical protein JSV58_01785, partial [Candidatus Bathyarchaeota archaeon]
MREYQRILLLIILVIGLSVTSTAASSINTVNYQEGPFCIERGTPPEEIPEYDITQHGFPHGWYRRVTITLGGQVTSVDFRLIWQIFIIDTILYVVLYSAIAAIILLAYRKYKGKTINTDSRYALIPQAYTIVALGISVVLLPFMPAMTISPWMYEMPQFLIYPVYTVEFYLWLSIALVWFTAFALSLRNIRKKSVGLTQAIGQNRLVVSLAIITVIVALSGCLSLSLPMDIRRQLPPPYVLVFACLTVVGILGSIVCEPAWVIT